VRHERRRHGGEQAQHREAGETGGGGRDEHRAHLGRHSQTLKSDASGPWAGFWRDQRARRREHHQQDVQCE
jgi:hypothetical protein